MCIDIVQCVLDSVQCAIDIVQCVLDSVQCVLDIVQCVLDIVQCALDSVQCVLDSVQCVLDSVQCVLDSVQSVLDIVQCALDSVQCVLDSVKCAVCAAHTHPTCYPSTVRQSPRILQVHHKAAIWEGGGKEEEGNCQSKPEHEKHSLTVVYGYKNNNSHNFHGTRWCFQGTVRYPVLPVIHRRILRRNPSMCELKKILTIIKTRKSLFLNGYTVFLANQATYLCSVHELR